MAKSLYRSDGNLLRVPFGYPHAGKLWRGIEICCPSWDVGVWCEFVPVICDQKSSVYTPLYLTLESVAGVVDCPGVAGLDDATNALAKILLTQVIASPCVWQGEGPCVDPEDPDEFCMAVEVVQNDGSWSIVIYKGNPPQLTSFWVAATAGDVRDGAVDLASDLTNACDEYTGGYPPQWAHSGTLTLSVGDTT